MAQYFFHTHTATRHSDMVGLELLTDLDARAEAIRSCGELVRDNPDGFWGSRPWGVTVTDATGMILYEVCMNGSATKVATG